MPFPDEQLELFADAAFNADLTADPSAWVWTPLTVAHPSLPAQTISRLTNDPITIKRGTAVGASSAQTTSATLKMFNHDGALTPQRVASPYWPYVDAGTPIRLRMRTRTTPYVTDTFTRTVSNGWGTTDTGGYTWVGGTPSQYNTTGSTATITFTSKADSAKAIRIPLLQYDTEFLFDTACNVVATGTANLIGPTVRDDSGTGQYVWPAIELSLSGTVIASIRQLTPGNPSTTTLAQAVVAGLTYSAGTMLRCRTQVVGDQVRMRIWLAAGAEPAVWHAQARTTLTGTGTALGFRTVVFAANTNTLPVVFTVDNVTISQPPMERLQGYIADVQPTFVPQTGGTTWSTVAMTVAGVGSRLEKNQSPDYSPMRRSVQLSNPPPVAYWPCEDAQGASSVASAFPGYTPMIITGPAVLGFTIPTPTEYAAFTTASAYGSSNLISVAAGAKLTGYVPPITTQNQWAISAFVTCSVPDVPLTSMRLLAWDTPGCVINRWALIGTNTGYIVRAYNDSVPTTTDVVINTGGAFNAFLNLTVEANQNAGNVDVRLYYNDNPIGSGSIAATLQQITRIVVNPDRANTTASVSPYGIRFIVGHVRVLDDVNAKDTPFYIDPDRGNAPTALFSWWNESAHRRLNRLCAEERIPFSWVGNPQGTGLTVVNSQQNGGFSDLIKQAADTESGGLLYEDRWGYQFLPRSVRYNQATALTIDMATYAYSDGTDPGSILVPQLDSRATNYWTITRTNGSSGSAAADAAYRQRRGTIAEEATLDVFADTDTTSHASWRVHTGVDAQGADYPSIPLDLAANPTLIDQYLAVTIGSRVKRTNQPTLAGLGVIDQVVEGITETLSPTSWVAELSASDATVWDVGVYDDPSSRYDAKTTVVAGTAPTTTSAAWTVSSTLAGDVWSTTAVPYNWVVMGEVVTVTTMNAATGSGPYVQTCTVIRSVNGIVRAHNLGEKVALAAPVRYAL